MICFPYALRDYSPYTAEIKLNQRFLLLPSTSLTSSPFFHSPTITFLKVLYLPSPCFSPFSQFPSYFSPFPYIIVPKPSRLPFLQLPLYLFPLGQQYSPSPCFSLPLHCPKQLSPVSECIRASPSSRSSRNSPSKMHPFCISTPRPCFLLFRNSPVQVLPSRQLAAPFPLGKLCFHWPSQAQPETSVQRPQPSATLFRKSPSQRLPSFLMKRPCPSQLPRTKSPSKQSPQSNYRKPLPWGNPSSSSPWQQAPNRSTQTLRPSSADCEREGSCWRRDLIPLDRFDCILRTLLVRMATCEWPALLLRVESDSKRLKGEEGSSSSSSKLTPLGRGAVVWQQSCPMRFITIRLILIRSLPRQAPLPPASALLRLDRKQIAGKYVCMQWWDGKYKIGGIKS